MPYFYREAVPARSDKGASIGMENVLKLYVKIRIFSSTQFLKSVKLLWLNGKAVSVMSCLNILTARAHDEN